MSPIPAGRSWTGANRDAACGEAGQATGGADTGARALSGRALPCSAAAIRFSSRGVMSAELQAGSSFRLSTGDLPPSRGLSALREVFDRKVQLNLEVRADRPVHAQMTVQGVPGLRVARMVSTLDVRLSRPRPMLSDGEDDVCLIVKTSGGLSIQQRRQTTAARDGDAVLLVYREPATLDFLAMNYAAIRVPHAALAPAIRNIGADAARCIGRETPALHLLQAYLAGLPAAAADPKLRSLFTTHVYDLMALVIGASPEGREQAAGRGLRAARLAAIRADLDRDLTMTLDQIARRQGVSPRCVQMLFEQDGTTFTAFVLERRLEAARSRLASPRFADWSIAAVALDAGFGDLSYFNRRFRQRYLMTPSDMRAQARARFAATPDAGPRVLAGLPSGGAADR